MRSIGPSRAVRRLEEEVETIKAALVRRYGRISSAPDAERKDYIHKQNDLRAARQKHKMIYKDHFDAKGEEELQKQSQGIQEPEAKL